MSEGRVLAAVAAGGATGTLARWVVFEALPEAGPGWGWATLIVNITGALAMGVLVAWLATRVASPLLRPFAAVGVLGGYTTYSTFALDVHATSTGEGVASALGYVAATLALGIGACVVGLVLGERWFGLPPEMSDDLVREEL